MWSLKSAIMEMTFTKNWLSLHNWAQLFEHGLAVTQG